MKTLFFCIAAILVSLSFSSCNVKPKVEPVQKTDVSEFFGQWTIDIKGGSVGWLEGHDDAIGCCGNDGIVCAVEDGLLEDGEVSKTLFAFLQDRLCLLDIRDIQDNAGEASTLGQMDSTHRQVDREDGPVLASPQALTPDAGHMFFACLKKIPQEIAVV